MSEMPSPPASTSLLGGMSPLARQGLIGAGILVVGVLVGWIGRGTLAGSPDLPNMTVYQDWRLACPTYKDKESCRMSQDIVDTRDGRPIVNLMVYTEKDKDKHDTTTLAVNVPLNVALDPGLQLKIGGNTQTYQYKTCTEAGCVAFVPVDAGLEKSIGGAKDAAVSVTRLDGKAIPLPFSSKGFTDARKAFRQFDAKRSWWWRLWL